MLKDRTELENNLSEVISNIKPQKTKVGKIKNGLKAYNITPGEAQSYLNNADEILPELDLRVLCLLTEQAYLASGDLKVKTDEYFTETEIKTARTFDSIFEHQVDTLDFPLTIPNVLMIDSENYMTYWDTDFIKKILPSLRYNFDTQREAKFVKRQESIEKVVNLNMNSVKEITDRLLKGNLSVTTITINALAGTADEGDELTYDSKKMELTINRGTFLDIIDGFHRITGTNNALDINPEINHIFQVSIKNFNVAQAQRHLAEISKQNAINKSHIQSLEAARYSDAVVKQLQRESDLKGRVSQTNRVHYINNELVSYSLLADTIDEEFKMDTKKDAMVVGDYLTKFFDYLIGTYPESFVESSNEIRKESLINVNVMFAGYVVLAKRMKEEGIPLSELENILGKINFNRNHKDWEELNILDENKITNKSRKKIKEYFSKLKLK